MIPFLLTARTESSEIPRRARSEIWAQVREKVAKGALDEEVEEEFDLPSLDGEDGDF